MNPNIKLKHHIIISIGLLFIIGSIFHFLYSLSQQQFLIGLISPINESIFEHTKMVVLPITLWWSIYYLLNKDNIYKNAWFTAALISLLIAIITIPLLFYFYTGAFAIESLAIDIAILFVAIMAGQLIALHYYNHGKGINYRIAIVLIILIITIFALLTIMPFRLPFFQDPIDKTYSIYKSL